jgi:hypothetical protein
MTAIKLQRIHIYSFDIDIVIQLTMTIVIWHVKVFNEASYTHREQ